MPTTTAEQLLVQSLNPYERRLNQHALVRQQSDYARWQKEQRREEIARSKHVPRRVRRKWLEKSSTYPSDRRGSTNTSQRLLFDYLSVTIPRKLEELAELNERYEEFRWSLAHAPTARERRRVILGYASDLGASRWQLRGDRQAFARWFDEDAMSARYLRRRGEAEHELALYVRQIGQIASHIIRSCEQPDRIPELWRRLEVERLVQEVLAYRGDSRVHLAALRCLSANLEAMPSAVARQAINDKTVTYVQRAAMDPKRDTWIQCESLRLLKTISPTSFDKVLKLRLTNAIDGDDLFVRRRAASLMADQLAVKPQFVELLPNVADDPSAFVRQELARAIWHAPTDVARYWIAQIAREDCEPRVRAVTLLEAVKRTDRIDLRLPFLHLLVDVLESESDSFVLRVALHIAGRWLYLANPSTPSETEAAAAAGKKHEQHDAEAAVFENKLLPAIRRVQTTADSVPVRRWAAQAGERIWCALDKEARSLYLFLERRTETVRAGKSNWISRQRLRQFDDDLIGRVSAVLAQDNFGCDFEKHLMGYRLTRGPVFEFRFWRLLHELVHPATDKRQAFSHTIGRGSHATIRVPSAIMGELSETKVPGEPLVDPSEGSWRPYLPLVDDFLSALGVGMIRPKPVRFYTSEGITEVTAPNSFMRKATAYFRLTLGFASYARLRNWTENDSTPAGTYVKSMRKLGFDVRFRRYDEQTGNSHVKDVSLLRFFPCLVPLLGPEIIQSLRKLFYDYAAYFTSAFENNLLHLLIFSTVILILFLGKHLYSNWTLRRARRQIPFSVGGWGTRGKSGTERLKAALFNSLGYGVVSKSTGCEAMFLHCHAHGELSELPLFRPYDKATIWEHRNVIRLASRLKPATFLWECMGLTPSYVDILQRQWTKDDMATITNTYPDHEDLQGPAGINVAQTIAGFVPAQSELFTTEQQMRPILDEACEKVGTSLGSVGWIESGLLTDDVLDRFSYMEHPDNVALVIALAEKIGCEADVALKAMPDCLVPDLGVLKTYPPSHVRSRVLEFTNGMSANERFGCLGNWSRMNFDAHDPHEEPDVWVTTVVNNRADRVPRSRVFAKILVNDIQADRHFLIGNNLKGLQGFIWEAWEEYAQTISLWSAGPEPAKALETLCNLAKRFRQPTEEQHVKNALKSMLIAAAEIDAKPFEEEILDNLLESWWEPERVAGLLKALGFMDSTTSGIALELGHMLRARREYTELASDIASASDAEREQLDNKLRNVLRGWFERKLVVVDDYHATGEQIIYCICEETPPGYRNRIMGLQNIKGTGMDFVHRWQAWEACHAACGMLSNRNPQTAQKGLQALVGIQHFGQLCNEHVRKGIHEAQRASTLQREQFQAELEALLKQLDAGVAKTGSNPVTSVRRNGRLDGISNILRDFADVNDAIRRRKRADRIYKDLQAERISWQRAAQELRTLDKRQKDGGLQRTSAHRQPHATREGEPSKPAQQAAVAAAVDLQCAPRNT